MRSAPQSAEATSQISATPISSCASATKEDPSYKLAQGIELFRRLRLRGGFPIGADQDPARRPSSAMKPFPPGWSTRDLPQNAPPPNCHSSLLTLRWRRQSRANPSLKWHNRRPPNKALFRGVYGSKRKRKAPFLARIRRHLVYSPTAASPAISVLSC